ncbi:hypothetical protein ACFPRL_17170 [Pseudoclavibacter helvolus]
MAGSRRRATALLGRTSAGRAHDHRVHGLGSGEWRLVRDSSTGTPAGPQSKLGMRGAGRATLAACAHPPGLPSRSSTSCSPSSAGL